MSEECEFIIASRAERGESVPCGKPGSRRRVSRQLAVTAVLCDDHAKTMVKLGFEIAPFNPTTLPSEAELHQKRAVALPLFSESEER